VLAAVWLNKRGFGIISVCWDHKQKHLVVPVRLVTLGAISIRSRMHGVTANDLEKYGHRAWLCCLVRNAMGFACLQNGDSVAFEHRV